jgi:hypothetical protein
VIETAGADLAEIMWHADVCWERTTTNSIINVIEVLGISAARVLIFHELRQLIAGDSSKVDDRHLMMVANCMTQNGVIMSLSRHGINRIADTGPLLRASFEETSEVLTDAGVFSERDTVQGVSQSIMLGKTPFVGTGCSSVLRLRTVPKETNSEAADTHMNHNAFKSAYHCRVGQSRFNGNKRGQKSMCSSREGIDTLFGTDPAGSSLQHLNEDAGLMAENCWFSSWQEEGLEHSISDMFGEDLFSNEHSADRAENDTETDRNNELVEVVSRMPYRAPLSPLNQDE